QLPAFRPRNSLELGLHLEAGRFVVAPPAAKPGAIKIQAVALVHEHAAGRAGAAVEILVAAPDGKVGARIVQLERDIARAVGEINPGDGADLVCRADDARQ